MVFGIGVFAVRVATALIAITLLLLQTKGICNVLKYRHILLGISIGVPAIIVIALAFNVALETPSHGQKTDPIQYGPTQAILILGDVFLFFLTTMISIIPRQRYQITTTVGGKSRFFF